MVLPTNSWYAYLTGEAAPVMAKNCILVTIFIARSIFFFSKAVCRGDINKCDDLLIMPLMNRQPVLNNLIHGIRQSARCAPNCLKHAWHFGTGGQTYV